MKEGEERGSTASNLDANHNSLFSNENKVAKRGQKEDPVNVEVIYHPYQLGGASIDPRPTDDPPRTTFSSLMFKNQPLD